MHKYILIIAFSLFTVQLFSQDNQQKQDEAIYEFTDEPATFPGDLMQFVDENLEIPDSLDLSKLPATVYLELIIRQDGSIGNAKVRRDFGGGSGKAALEMVKRMPNWIPAKMNGRPVSQRLTIPVRFVL